MSRQEVREILDRVLTWPAERQADAARILALMERQDDSGLGLSEEQAAEVRRRLATPRDDENIPARQVFERLRSPRA